MTPMRLEPGAPRSRVKHSTTEPLRYSNNTYNCNNMIYNLYMLVLLYNIVFCSVQKVAISFSGKLAVFTSDDSQILTHVDFNYFLDDASIKYAIKIASTSYHGYGKLDIQNISSEQKVVHNVLFCLFCNWLSDFFLNLI